MPVKKTIEASVEDSGSGDEATSSDASAPGRMGRHDSGDAATPALTREPLSTTGGQHISGDHTLWDHCAHGVSYVTSKNALHSGHSGSDPLGYHG